MDSHKFFTGFGLLTLSLAAHGTVFLTMDRAVSLYQMQAIQSQQQLMRQRQGRLEFEFVESTPKAHLRKPIRSKKISNRDALNQDLVKDKAKAALMPRSTSEGWMDQLAQKQGNPSQMPVAESKPENARRPHPAEKPDQEGPKAVEEQQPVKNVSPLIPTQSSQDLEKPSVLERPGTPSPQTQPPQDHDRNDLFRNPEPAKPKIEPKAQMIGTGNGDKITAQEMSKIKSPGAQLFGQTSFEATGSGMGEYMKNLKEKIWLAWFPYLAYQYPQDFRGADVVVSLTLNASGQVRMVQLIDSVGSPVFASYCLEAIQRASGFGPVPKEILTLIGKDELEIKFGFHYR